MIENLKSYWRVFLSLGFAISFAVYLMLSQAPADTGDLAILVTVVMSAILALQVAESYDLRARFQEMREQTREAVGEALREHDTAQLVPFRRTADYMELFDGLEERCYVYNPHQFAPDTTDIDVDEIVASTVRRYQDARFVAIRYLVCVGDGYGLKNFVRFCDRLRRVHQASRKPRLVEDKIRVCVVPDCSFSQEPTYHIQKKGVARSVIELRLAPLTVPGSAIPNFYLTSTAPDLRAKLQAHFDAAWPRAREVDLTQLFRPDFQVSARSVQELIAQALDPSGSEP